MENLAESQEDFSWTPIQIFVGGISPLVDTETLQKFFSQYGKLLECRVVCDKDTGKSRGFGFVTFSNKESSDRVLFQKMILYGKELECKEAVTKTQSRNNMINEKNRKVFVGGIPLDLESKEFINYFKQFGEIKDARIIYEQDNYNHLLQS